MIVKKGLLCVSALLSSLLFFAACAPSETNEPIEEEEVLTYIPYTAEDSSPKMLQEASWIWNGTNENNEWVDFQKTFTLDAVPSEAIAEIAVENKYFLSVNGVQVVYEGGLRRGADTETGYFDTVDLAPYLKKGENVIAVKAWFWGVKGKIGDITYKSYTNVPVETAGFIFAMKAGEKTVVSDSTWQTRKDYAYKDDTPLGVAQPNERFAEYNIYYDASEEETDWQKAEVRGRYGEKPWNTLVKRSVPLIREYGLNDYLNSDSVEGAKGGQTLTMELPYNAQITPYLKVVADREATITILTENTVSAKSVYTTYVTKVGEQEWESPAWISGQHIRYIIPEGVTVLSLKYRESGYDTEIAGSFSMGNDFFDALWTMGARTQMVCIRENYMDCPDRERAQWCGDATTQMRTSMYALTPSSYALYQKMMTQKVGFTKDNLLATVCPHHGEFYELPSQELAGIIGIWDYYTYTGDVSVLYTMYDSALNYLKLWKFYTSGSNEGLIRHKTGQGLPDWQDTASGVDTKVCDNAWYYWALKVVRNMGIVTGNDTSWQTEKMEGIEKAFDKLWVEGKGYLSDEKPDDRGNALAVLSGLASEDKYPTIENVLKTTLTASSYMEAYVLTAMFEMGYAGDALDRIQTRFSSMVQTNLDRGDTTLWEYFTEMGTYNHAWSASPVYLLSKYVGGIRPTRIGYAAYEIVPTFDRSGRVSASCQTVKGTISVTAEKKGDSATVSVSLVDGKAVIAVPKAGNTVTVNGSVIKLKPSKENVSYRNADDNYYYFEVVGGGNYTFECMDK